MNEAHEKSAADRQSACTNDLEKAGFDIVQATLATSPKGLASSEAKQWLEKCGRNELVEEEVNELQKFLRFFTGPIAYMIDGRRGALAIDGALGGPDHHPGAALLQRHLGVLAVAQGLRCPGPPPASSGYFPVFVATCIGANGICACELVRPLTLRSCAEADTISAAYPSWRFLWRLMPLGPGSFFV